MPPIPEIMERSCCNSRFATVQPRFSRPTRSLFCARTLSKKHWQNGESPEISTMGVTVTPGSSMGNRTKLMPSCFGASGSVRTRQKIQSAKVAPEVQIFEPLTR